MMVSYSLPGTPNSSMQSRQSSSLRQTKSFRNSSFRRAKGASSPGNHFREETRKHDRASSVPDDKLGFLRPRDHTGLNKQSPTSSPCGARRVQSFRCTSKGSVVRQGDDFFLGTASPQNYRPPDGNSNALCLPSHSPYNGQRSVSSESLRPSKIFRVYIIGSENVGKKRIAAACINSHPVAPMKTTILIDGEQFEAVFKVIRHLDQAFTEDDMETIEKRNQALLIVYSITERKSFEIAGQMLALAIIRLLRFNPDFPICLIGNKSDLVRARAVSTSEAQTFARRFDANFIETSAEIGPNFDEVMVWIVARIRETLSVHKGSEGSSHKSLASTGKVKVMTRAKSCIRRIFKHLRSRSRSMDDLHTL